MIGKYHKSITTDALTPLRDEKSGELIDKNLYLSDEAINLIAKSNNDADSKKARAAAGYGKDAQHFNNTNLEECQEFLEEAQDVVIDDFIKAAKVTDDNKDDESYTKAFYDLGRVMHCIQDFYSHSNWINQTGAELKLWNESVEKPNIDNPKKLKTGKYNAFFQFLQQLNPFAGRNLKKGKNYDKTYVETGKQTHFILNKDKEGTIADKAFKAKTGMSGFELACDDAEQHTKIKWQEIMQTLDEKLDDETYNELLNDIEDFKPDDETIDKSLKNCRTNFDEMMDD